MDPSVHTLNNIIIFSAFGGDTKGDLIAELKLSHTIGGVSKLRSEQVKIQNIFQKEIFSPV